MSTRCKWIAASFLALTLLLSGCASGLDSTPTLIPFNPKAGHWEGATNSIVSFDVTEDGSLINFKIDVNGECNSKSNGTFQIGADRMLLIGEVNDEGKPVNNGIVGTFWTETSIDGKIDGSWECGGSGVTVTMYMPDALTVWSAEWVSP
jgi:hypothetical protein